LALFENLYAHFLPVETSIVSMTETTGRYIIIRGKEFNKRSSENCVEVADSFELAAICNSELLPYQERNCTKDAKP
jgi:hypothetical protein